MKHDPERGLTLLEVAIVLAVIAVLAALALPDVGRRMERQRLQFAAQSLAADLTDARFEAARRSQDMYVQAQMGTDWCWAVSAATDCGCGQAQSCQIHRVAAATHRGVRLTQGMVVRLTSDGAAQGSHAVALLESSRGDRLQVDVSPLGRARVCAAAGTFPNLAPC